MGVKKYLKIKNAIIAFLVTAIYLNWLVEGLNIAKMIIACIAIFVSMLAILELADKGYMKANKKSAQDNA